MKRIIYAIGCFVLALCICQAWAQPKKSDEKQNVAQSRELDSQWLKDNQELIHLVNEKKNSEAIQKGIAMLKYLEKKKLMESQEAATTYNNIGMAYLAAGQFDKSQENLLKALKLRTKIFGNTSVEVATVWLNLSQLYKMQAQYIFQLHNKPIEPSSSGE